jgi:hypothetical protein
MSQHARLQCDVDPDEEAELRRLVGGGDAPTQQPVAAQPGRMSRTTNLQLNMVHINHRPPRSGYNLLELRGGLETAFHSN